MHIIEKIEKAFDMLSSCNVCPRNCGVNRLKGEIGFCGIGEDAIVSSYGPHFGEESPLVGMYGSGTIFFAGCNLKCVFCQNYDISQLVKNNSSGKVDSSQLATIMLGLQNQGCHNINLVTPTHVTPQIIKAIYLAQQDGLNIPIVYNCGGYESVNTLKLLEGVVDIYMPDSKYSSNEHSKKFSFADDYFEVMKNAIKEMHRQVGDLRIDKGLATQGLLVRHLVMPNNVSGSKEIIDFLASDLSTNTYINVMEQYRPMFNASKYHEINRRITSKEFIDVYNYAKEKGFRLAD